MRSVSKLEIAIKALRELGLGQVSQYAWYKILLRTGYIRWATRNPALKTAGARRDQSRPRGLSGVRPLFRLPAREQVMLTLGESGLADLLKEADEILSGQVRLFGGEPQPLNLSPPGPLLHWTRYDPGRGELGDAQDIKFLWEPGRFGWAYILGRAYYLSQDERYAEGFWKFTETFWEANPPYLGPHWVSAQEVALRLLALVFAYQIFSPSIHTTTPRSVLIYQIIADHARRIPPSMTYARAQNNNHLLSEAVGLYTAGLALPNHPKAVRWQKMGWRWIQRGLQKQIAEDGAYIQHSTNYHRLMLQLALWVHALPETQRQPFPAATRQSLSAATRWLLELVDGESGRVPNLGPNDGAYIQPLTVCPFHDFRPVLQAAGAAFLGERPYPAGLWDEMSLWVGDVGQGIGNRGEVKGDDVRLSSPPVLRIPQQESWAYLRAAHFTSRPGHADQLHLDLWWRGINLAQDAGTYLYNAPPPWDNSLSRTGVHNTLSVDGQDQMTRGGRFLWLDWAQADGVAYEKSPDGSWERMTASHNGYRRLGLVHQRAVTAYQDGRWMVEDSLVRSGKPKVESSKLKPTNFSLHWLLPDWEWEMVERGESSVAIYLASSLGSVLLMMQPEEGTQLTGIQLVRAGELLVGDGAVAPYQGWLSPTYGQKIPALSLTIAAVGTPPCSIVSRWIFETA